MRFLPLTLSLFCKRHLILTINSIIPFISMPLFAAEAVDDLISIFNDVDRSSPINILSNDTGVGTLTVTQAGNVSTLNADGGYWAACSNGGHFWINPEGLSFFFHEGAFNYLTSGEQATSSVTYTVTDSTGGADVAIVTATIVSADERTQYRSGDPDIIEHPEKIGLGAWWATVPGYENVPGYDYNSLTYFNTLEAGWYYTWDPKPLPGDSDMTFVPMIWDGQGRYFDEKTAQVIANYDTLLAFNEPDHGEQANLTVEQALDLWPRLEATGLRLGTPATASWVLDDGSWLARFMTGAKTRGYRVDFIALHTYTTDPDVRALESYLISVYKKYQLPIWITEFALVDFSQPKDSPRFTLQENARFLTDTYKMLDDLKFVERHAWFAPLDGGDGWHMNSNFVDSNGKITPVGQAYQALMDTVRPEPTAPSNLRVLRIKK